MKTFSQWMEGQSRQSFSKDPGEAGAGQFGSGLPSFNRDYYSPSPKGGNSYSHHLAMFMKLAKQDGGRELTQNELEALERHKQIDKEFRARMQHKI
jgi:hypothetical protein